MELCLICHLTRRNGLCVVVGLLVMVALLVKVCCF